MNKKRISQVLAMSMLLSGCSGAMAQNNRYSSVGGGWLYESGQQSRVIIEGEAVNEYFASDRHDKNSINDAITYTKADYTNPEHLRIVEQTTNSRTDTDAWKMKTMRKTVEANNGILDSIKKMSSAVVVAPPKPKSMQTQKKSVPQK